MKKRNWPAHGFTVLLVLAIVFGAVRGQPGAAPADAAYPETAFTAPYNISNSVAENNTQHPRAALDPSAFLHAAWMEGTDDPYPKANGPAYERGRYQDWPGWEWAGPHNNQGYTNPSIAIDSTGAVHLVWAASGSGGSPYDIWYATKPVGGSWSAPQNLSDEGNNTVYPDIACDSLGGIWVVWQVTYSNGDTDVMGRNRPAGGNWGTVVAIANSGAQDQNPRLAIDSADVPHVVWRNNSIAGNWEILYSKYVGGHWTGAYNVSADSTNSHYPDIAAHDTDVYVVWEDEIDGPDGFQILSRRWNGGAWLAWEQVSLTSKALFPAVSAASGALYAVWQDYRGGGLEIYFSHSTDSGASWQINENVSHNSTSSYFPEVVAQAGGLSHIFWEDGGIGHLDIYYSRGGTPAEPPTGQVDILAHTPPNDRLYTNQLTVTLHLTATSPAGYPITQMRLCNAGACSPLPAWIPYATAVTTWPLLNTPYHCEYKYVNAWFQDNLGLESITATDFIRYDDYVTASMALNNDYAYTNRLTVTVNSTDREALDPDCSGLEAMRLGENGVTYTAWMSFTPSVEFVLSPSGPLTRTVYAQYRDRADNVGTFSDQIAVDTIPPYSPTAPTMPVSTTAIVITVTGLLAHDDESGVARAWMANGPAGPWGPFTYYQPPHAYRWSLAYGGPPPTSPVTLTVYVKYEDAAGYGGYPGNFSEVVSNTIRFEGVVYNVYLPLIEK
jgi:hypothetical protein